MPYCCFPFLSAKRTPATGRKSDSALMGYINSLRNNRDHPEIPMRDLAPGDPPIIPERPLGITAAVALTSRVAVNLQEYLAANSTMEERIQVQNTPIIISSVKDCDPKEMLMIRSTRINNLGKDGDDNNVVTVHAQIPVAPRKYTPIVAVPIPTAPPQPMMMTRQEGRASLHSESDAGTVVSKPRKTCSPLRFIDGTSEPHPTAPPEPCRVTSWLLSQPRYTSPPPGFYGTEAPPGALANPIDCLPGVDYTREEAPLGPLWEVRDSNNEQLTFEFPGWEMITAKELIELKAKNDEKKKKDKMKKAP